MPCRYVGSRRTSFSSYGFLGGMAMKGASCAIGRFFCAARSGLPDAVNRSGYGVSCRSRSVRRMGDSAGLFPASVRGRSIAHGDACGGGRPRRKPASASVRCACPDRCPRGRCDGRKAVFSCPRRLVVSRRASATDRDRSFLFAKVRFRSAVSEAVRYRDAMNFARCAEASSCIDMEMIGSESPFAVVSTAGTGECRAVCCKPGKGAETDSRPHLSGPADQYCRNLGVMISA